MYKTSDIIQHPDGTYLLKVKSKNCSDKCYLQKHSSIYFSQHNCNDCNNYINYYNFIDLNSPEEVSKRHKKIRLLMRIFDIHFILYLLYIFICIVIFLGNKIFWIVKINNTIYFYNFIIIILGYILIIYLSKKIDKYNLILAKYKLK